MQNEITVACGHLLYILAVLIELVSPATLPLTTMVVRLCEYIFLLPSGLRLLIL